MLMWLPSQELAERVGPVPGAQVDLLPDCSSDDLPASAAHVEVVVLPQAPSAAMVAALAHLPRLRIIQALSAGVEHLLDAVPEGAVLVDARGVHTPSTAEWVCAAVLACERGLPAFVRAQDERRWQPTAARTLDGATVLLVGYGSIGEAVEQRLRPFGCRFLRVARRARDDVSPIGEVAELLPAADVVVLLVPLTEQTAALVDERFLAAMPDGALLVNGSRGPVVDTDALLKELSSGRLRAALDVTEPEPLPSGHPLWTAPGLLLTPHVGGAVPTVLSRQAAFLAERLPRWAAGETPRDVVSDGY